MNCKSDTGEPAPLYEAMSELDIGWGALQSILQCDGPKARLDKARDLLHESGGKREKALQKLADVIHRGFCDSPVNATKETPQTTARGQKRPAHAWITSRKTSTTTIWLPIRAVRHWRGRG